MTSLVTLTDTHSVLVVSDTLAVRADTGAPVALVSKVFPLPQVAALATARGDFDFIHQWRAVAEQAAVEGFDALAAETPKHLRELRRVGWYLNGRALERSTIYLWGQSATAGRLAGWFFSSREDFEAQAVPDGFMVAPNVPDRPDLIAALDKAEDVLAAMREVVRAQALDRQTDDPDRNHAGGSILTHSLTLDDGGPLFQIRRIGDLPTLGDDLRQARQYQQEAWWHG